VTFALGTSLFIKAIQYGGSKHVGTFGKDFGETLPEYVAPDRARSLSSQNGSLAIQSLFKILTFLILRNARLSNRVVYLETEHH